MTRKELDSEIITLHKQGLSGKEISEKLYISQAKAYITIQEYKTKIKLVTEMALEMYFQGVSAKKAIGKAREVLENHTNS